MHNHTYARVAPLLQGDSGSSHFALTVEGPILKSLLLCGNPPIKLLIGELTDNRRTSYFPLTKTSSEKFHASENNIPPQEMAKAIPSFVRKCLQKGNTVGFFFFFERKISNN